MITLELVIRSLFFLLAGIANAYMDKLQFHYSTSVFPQSGKRRQWYDPEISWRNKYKDYPDDKRPAFFLSKNFLVFLTDAWHFWQFIFLTSLSLAATPIMPIWWQTIAVYLWFRLAFGLGFTLWFKGFLHRRIPTPKPMDVAWEMMRNKLDGDTLSALDQLNAETQGDYERLEIPESYLKSWERKLTVETQDGEKRVIEEE